MSILSSLLLAVLTAFSISAMEPTIESGHADHISVYIDNVGQGNLIRVEIPYKTEPKKAHIVVDCGSGSYRHEFRHMAALKGEKDPLELAELLQQRRRDLGGAEENPLHIMALILTHPDSDHINQVPAFFNHRKDQIDYIICGGLPEMYQKQGLDFGEWINQLIRNNSRVYFPVISYDPIRNFSEVLPLHADPYQPYEAWAERKFTSEDYTNHPFPHFFGTLKAINDEFRLYFLAVNPTRVTEAGGVARLTNATTMDEKEKETNTDSLILKISYGDASMILPGDATGTTTSRIRFTYSAPFLKSPVLLLAHHGSITESSNNDVWLNLVQPEYILISTGHTYGHPHKEALEKFQSLASLKKNVTPHQISWTKGRTHRKRKEASHAVFLTYESGDLTTELFKDGRVKLATQMESEIRDLEGKEHSPITFEERHSSSSSSDDEEREPELPPSSSSSTHSKKRTHSPTKDENRKKAKEDQSKTKGKGTGKKESQGSSSSKQDYNRKNLQSFLQYLTERNNNYKEIADSSIRNGYKISHPTVGRITGDITYGKKKDYSQLWEALKKAYPNDFKSWLNS